MVVPLWRRTLTLSIIWVGRRIMPLLVAAAGDRCWECGAKITPTEMLPIYHIVEARVWRWNKVVCDTCIRQGLAGEMR